MTRVLVTAAFALLLLSCSSSVRYSPSEISTYDSPMQEHIKKGEVVLGMTPLQVRYAWGAPNAVRIPGADEEGRFKEVWIYARMRIFSTKLVFTDGKLTGILSGVAERKPLFEEKPQGEAEEGGDVREESGTR